ncbi:MAG: helix-turn-helix domain-containing protein [Bacteroidales bacterium]|jgi:predicted DNA-binding transcriptional regulator AlpA/endogenous inhibitor of DNA gyrase (YacG/DUF329 family)|nr:helix-turn-helix domain-containing protein [Bacteroidales bacterium]
MARIKATIRRICEVCGNEFVASQSVSHFCSKKCSKKAYKIKLRNEKIVKSNAETEQQRIENRQKKLTIQMGYSVAETAELLGVCRQTVYNLVYVKKLNAKRITSRMTFISRESIAEFLTTTTQYEKLPAKEQSPIIEWYSKQEAMSKLNVEFTKYRRIVNENRIPEMKKGVYSFVSKKHIDKYFQQISEENKIDNKDNWLTVSEIAETYGISLNSVYSYVSTHGIPKKILDGRIKVYSKQHIDKLKKKKV